MSLSYPSRLVRASFLSRATALLLATVLLSSIAQGQRGLTDVWLNPSDPDRWRIPADDEAVEGTQNFWFVTHHDVRRGNYMIGGKAENMTVPDADTISFVPNSVWGDYIWTITYLSGTKIATGYTSSNISGSRIGWNDFAALAGQSGIALNLKGTIMDTEPGGAFTATIELDTGDSTEITARFAPTVVSEKTPLPDQRSVLYGPDWRQTYDLYLPETPYSDPMPLVVYIHGGGWGAFDKQNGQGTAKTYTAKGFAVASINYRYISDGETDPPVGSPMFESARAIQQLRYFAPSLGIDPERVAYIGGSAGGCTSVWLALHDDLAEPDSDDPIARQSTRPYCVHAQQPQTSLDPLQMREWIPSITYGSHAYYHRSERPSDDAEAFDFMLANRDSILDEIAIFNPYAHASAYDPPHYLDFTGQTSEIPALSSSQATHHPMFGVKLKERFDALGVESYRRASDDTEYSYSGNFMFDKLTTDFNPDLDGDGLNDYWERVQYGDAGYYNASDDPNGDGQPVLLDYALDLSPTRKASEQNLPAARLAEIDGEPCAIFRYRRNRFSAQDVLKIFYSTDLKNWPEVDLDALGAEEVVVSTNADGDGSAEWRELRIPLSALPGDRFFFRAEASIE